LVQLAAASASHKIVTYLPTCSPHLVPSASAIASIGSVSVHSLFFNKFITKLMLSISLFNYLLSLQCDAPRYLFIATLKCRLVWDVLYVTKICEWQSRSHIGCLANQIFKYVKIRLMGHECMIVLLNSFELRSSVKTR